MKIERHTLLTALETQIGDTLAKLQNVSRVAAQRYPGKKVTTPTVIVEEGRLSRENKKAESLKVFLREGLWTTEFTAFVPRNSGLVINKEAAVQRIKDLGGGLVVRTAARRDTNETPEHA